ncbi:MAG: hypothetical protein PHP42_08750 [Bacteroidota bacterium]|nr:hypothetical protein [Bacteroidota bacterium]
MNSYVRYAVAFGLIFVAALSRLVPHPLNFTPIAAMALFGAVYFNKRFAFIVPIAALAISDYILGFYTEMYFVYASFILIGFIGLWLKNRKSIFTVGGTTLASSVLFFVVTNFGVWLTGTMYTKDIAGLTECYVAAIPFFRNTLAGDFFYVAVLFGVYELVVRYAEKRNVVKA